MYSRLFARDVESRQISRAADGASRLRPFANEDIYLFVKRIDNTRVVREVYFALPPSSAGLVGLALSAMTLALEARLGALPVAAALSLAWIVFAVGARVGTGTVMTAYGPAVQLVCLTTLVAVAAFAAYGRHQAGRSS